MSSLWLGATTEEVPRSGCCMSVIRFSGIASGIDTSSLIESLLSQQRQLKITPLQDTLTTLTDSNDALSELKTLLSNLQSAAASLRTVNGGAIAKDSTSSNETVATAAVSNAANTGSYGLTVESLAKAGSVSFDARYASSDEALLNTINDMDPAIDRTIRFTLGTGDSEETIDIELTSSTTVSQFVQEFNESTDLADATLVNTGSTESPQYAIVIQSRSEGTEEGSVVVSQPGAGVNLGAYVADQTAISATDATFRISGIDGLITRGSNTVSDVLEGMTLKLHSTGSTTINVTQDTSATKTTIKNLVEAYNEVFEFVQENDAITLEQDGASVTPIFGALSNVSVDDSLIESLRSALRSAVATSGETRTLSDLGITTQRDGTLAFDEDIFEDGLEADPTSSEEVLSILGEEFGGTASGTVYQYIRYAGLLDNTTTQQSTQIANIQKQIAEEESNIVEQEIQLNARFAALEKLIGQLQSSQNALAGLIK